MTIVCMDKLTYKTWSDDYKISARTLPEIAERIETAVTALARDKAIRPRGRKMNNEALVNAAIMALLEMPDDQRRSVVASCVDRLNKSLEYNGDEDDAPPVDGTEPSPFMGVGVIDETDTEKRLPRSTVKHRRDNKRSHRSK